MIVRVTSAKAASFIFLAIAVASWVNANAENGQSANVQLLEQKYPRLKENIANVEELMAISDSRKDDLRYDPTKVYVAPKISAIADLPDGAQLVEWLPQDTKIHSALVESYNALNNQSEFIRYNRALAYEAADMMDKDEGAAKLNEGKISKEAFEKTLINRFHKRGIKIREFQLYRKHPDLAHLVQLDYVYSHWWSATKGNAQSVFNYLSTANGVYLWDRIFDCYGKSSYATSPALINSFLRSFQN